MPGQKYQDPSILKRTDVKRPFYYIQAFVPIFTPTGLVRKRHNIQLGFCDELTVRQAKSRKEQIMATINNGKFLIQSQIPFSEILRRFVEIRIPQLGSATQAKYRQHIEKHIAPAFKDTVMCDIDRPAVEAWLNGKAAAKLSHWTLLDLRNLLSAIFTKAAEWKLWQGDNPCVGIRVGGAVEIREKVIPAADELHRFLSAIRDTRVASAQAARLMVLTAVTTGLRVSEVLALRPLDVDGKSQTLTVRRRWHRGSVAEPKTKASRRERSIGALAEALLEFAQGRSADEYMFGREDRKRMPPDDRDLQQYVFRPAAETAGIYQPGFGMHTFRRLNITWRQTLGGASPFEAQKAAGHAQPSTTWMYTIAEREREQRHVDAILERLGTTAPPRLKTIAIQ